MVPRRASTRIEKLKQQREEQERIVAVAIEAELQHKGGSIGSQGTTSDPSPTSPPSEPPTKKSKKIDEDEWLAYCLINFYISDRILPQIRINSLVYASFPFLFISTTYLSSWLIYLGYTFRLASMFR